jgi:endonuclease/exonuclease/phosphatase family metal-dependent hydrolase
MEIIGDLLAGSDILGLQETHGRIEDLSQLRALFPNLIFEGTFSQNPAAGGTIACIRKDRVGDLVATRVLDEGRCIAVSFRAVQSTLHCIVIHLKSAYDVATNRNLLNTIRDHSATLLGPILLLGDFNFVTNYESRFDISVGGDTSQGHALAVHHDEVLADFVELYQADYTRKQTLGNRFRTLSRLDRIYLRVDPLDILIYTLIP